MCSLAVREYDYLTVFAITKNTQKSAGWFGKVKNCIQSKSCPESCTWELSLHNFPSLTEVLGALTASSPCRKKELLYNMVDGMHGIRYCLLDRFILGN